MWRDAKSIDTLRFLPHRINAQLRLLLHHEVIEKQKENPSKSFNGHQARCKTGEKMK